jgi:cytidyltransferase-like protein
MAKKKKILCAGSFDLLHSGHVAFLKTAATYGEVYVGIGSDASIKVFKNRETICPQEERLFMIKAIRYVKDAWINRGVGDMDFVMDLEKNHPIKFDMFIFNEDQDTPEKREYCRRNNIKLLILKRMPEPGLPARCSTAFRKYYGK